MQLQAADSVSARTAEAPYRMQEDRSGAID